MKRPLPPSCATNGWAALGGALLLALAIPAHAQQPAVVADSVYTTQPVRLVHFSAQLYAEGGQLHWTTLGEGNSAAFVVQQSPDARTWQTLSVMEAHPGYTTRYDYVYADLRIRRYGVPVVYYRVQQQARDGSCTYSPVRPVRLHEPAGRVTTTSPSRTD